MSFKRYLNSDELDTLIATAESMLTAAKFVFSVIPYTGLTTDEFLHLREDWIYWRDAEAFDGSCPEIHIPARDTCENIKWSPKPPEYTSKEHSCHFCRQNGETDGFEAHSQMRQSADKSDRELSASRPIPVKSDRAETELRRWFHTKDMAGVPWTRSSVCQLVQSVANKSPVDGNITYPTLRWTFVWILAESGASKKAIAEYSHTTGNYSRRLSGDQEGIARTILEESSTEYDFQTMAIDRLRTIRKIEPATSSELQEAHGTHKATENESINTLLEEGLILEAGLRETPGIGRSPMQYRVHPEIDPIEAGGIPCKRESCDRTFLSLQARNKHCNQIHD